MVASSALDADSYLLNVRNGYLNLKTRELFAHDPERLMTNLAPVEFDPEATAPQWARFINRIFQGDQELIAYVQRAVGYSLTGDVSEQGAFIGVGSGSNGKTTFVNVIRKLLGDYSMRTPADTLIARQRGDSSHDIARLKGARLVAVSETLAGVRLDEARLKEITGKETIVSREHFKSNDEYEPQFKIWLMTNSLPVIRETNDGIWRRLRIIPFHAKFEGAERDLHLEEKLLAELSGILNWALEGLAQWRKRGLDEPKSVRAMLAGYRKSMDVIGSFLDECVISSPAARVSIQDLYRIYERWCALGREFVWKKRTLNKELRERGLMSDNNMPNGAPAWQNLSLTDYGRSLLEVPEQGMDA
jgi:putative DNA primase/helicase